MDLSYDWKSFQSIFCLRKRGNGVDSAPPIYLVTDKRVVISVFSEGEDFSDWSGATTDEVAARFPERNLVSFDRSKVDQCIGGSVSQAHYYDQIQYIQTESQPHLTSPKGMLKLSDEAFQKHFLLSAIRSWWHKVFPSTYAIYFCLDGNQENSLLVTIQRGKVSTFHVPDLSSMIPERRRFPSDVVRFLSERYVMPVQGLFLNSTEWADWSMSPNPWKKIAMALKSDRSKLVPFKWGVAAMIALKAFANV